MEKVHHIKLIKNESLLFQKDIVNAEMLWTVDRYVVANLLHKQNVLLQAKPKVAEEYLGFGTLSSMKNQVYADHVVRISAVDFIIKHGQWFSQELPREYLKDVYILLTGIEYPG